MEHYSAIKKEILSFVSTCIDFEGIMLSEIRKTGNNSYFKSQQYEDSKKKMSIDNLVYKAEIETQT